MIELVRERPWASTSRVPVAGGHVWFKSCAPAQAFEPGLSVGLFSRWPDRVAEVIGHEEQRSWLLLSDAGTSIGKLGHELESWLTVLPLYAELQRGEIAYTEAHLAAGVPNMRMAALAGRYEDLVQHELPLEGNELAGLRAFAPRFAGLCDELAAQGIPEVVQHDDLHAANVYTEGETIRVLDWGDASIAHPFFSLVVTFRFLEEQHGLPRNDPWFARLRDAYLEPWGGNTLVETFALALRVGIFAHAIAWLRQREHLPEHAQPAFDEWFRVVLRRAVGYTLDQAVVPREPSTGNARRCDCLEGVGRGGRTLAGRSSASAPSADGPQGIRIARPF